MSVDDTGSDKYLSNARGISLVRSPPDSPFTMCTTLKEFSESHQDHLFPYSTDVSLLMHLIGGVMVQRLTFSPRTSDWSSRNYPLKTLGAVYYNYYRCQSPSHSCPCNRFWTVDGADQNAGYNHVVPLFHISAQIPLPLAICQ